jgi:pyruvate kinase
MFEKPVVQEADEQVASASIEACRAALLSRAAEIEEEYERILADWNPHIERENFRLDAENLAYYLAARQYDLTELQDDLSALGLSSLGRSESHPRQSIAAVTATLDRLTGRPGSWPGEVQMASGIDQITREQERFFGNFPGGRNTRIMVTMPRQGALDRELVNRMVDAGAGCFRINCAHDGPETWSAMIVNIRAATSHAGRICPIVMDIAGPKCRIETIITAGRKRLYRGDRFRLLSSGDEAADSLPAIKISFPHIIAKLQPGMLVWIDDGKIGARVSEIGEYGAELEVLVARDKGAKLKLAKGVNFPSVDLDIDPLTQKDIADIEFVAAHADIVGCSFIQEPEDIRRLSAELNKHRAGLPRLPLLLKIETGLAVRNLPRLIVEAGARQPVAVMIARGDLAMEVGTERLSEVQEEILWLCEASHIPVVWATQVLETLLKSGAPTRAEVTDAAMGQRAECVMLNKGPYITKTIRFLAGILRRMDRHQFKKTARLSALTSWRGPQPLGGRDEQGA